MLVLIVVCASLMAAECVPNGRRVLDDVEPADYGSFDCRTPDRLPGRCVPLNDCNSLMHLLEKPSRPIIAYLRNSTCGLLGSQIAVRIDQPIATFSWICCPAKEPQLAPFKPDAGTSKPTNKPVADGPVSTEALDDDGLLPADCGHTEVVRDRIVGGQISPKGAWPWMAMAIYRDNSTGVIKKWCGGALISDRHVLTAAHCFHQFKRPMMMVRLGEHIFNTEDDGAILQDIPIARAIIHEKYNDVTLRNDIALLVLKHKIKMAENVQPICLPRDRSLGPDRLEGERAFIAGWGRTKQNGNASLVLMEGMVPIIRQSQCEQAYSQVSLPNTQIHPSVLCAGYAEGGVDSCQGDSGGPLMLPLGQDHRFHLLGIVSWGIGCARPEYPGVYTRVPYFMDWIMTQLRSDSSA